MSELALPTFVLKEAVTAAVPLVLAGYGELVNERAGIINVGIEGLMLMGCIGGFGVALLTGSAWLGVGGAVGAGVALAAVFALATVWFRADQVVAGTALTLLASGLSTTVWTALQPRLAPGAAIPALFEPVTLPPALTRIPLIGPALFAQYGLFYVVFALGVLLWIGLRGTRAGLIIRALGDLPEACQAAGIRVRVWRTGCLLFAGACAGLAGAYLSIMRTHSFNVNMTGGQGFLVLALVIFGRWSVGGLVAGALLFGGLDGLQAYLRGPASPIALPHQLFEMLPYVATLAALAVMARGRPGPAFLGRPWPEDD